jgi:hypothetical protein
MKNFKHHMINVVLFGVALVIFNAVGRLVSGTLNDQKAPVDLAVFQYIPVGLVTLCAAFAVFWTVFHLFFPTINKQLDEGRFPLWWSECSEETKVKVTVFGLLALLYVCVYALHP